MEDNRIAIWRSWRSRWLVLLKEGAQVPLDEHLDEIFPFSFLILFSTLIDGGDCGGALSVVWG